MDQGQQYLFLLQYAAALGLNIWDAVSHHAKGRLTPEQYAELQTKWDALVVRTAANAGL